jgi:hypothetical protein
VLLVSASHCCLRHLVCRRAVATHWHALRLLQELAALAADHDAALAEREAALAACESRAQEQAEYYDEMLQQTELDLEDQSDRWAVVGWWWSARCRQRVLLAAS